MTNHKAVSFTCLRLFILERFLAQLLKPTDFLPTESQIRGGEPSLLGELSVVLDLPPDTPCLLNPSITLQYQEFRPRSYCRTPEGLFLIQELVAVGSRSLCFGERLVFSGFDPRTNLKKFSRLKEEGFFELTRACHLCFLDTIEGDELLLNHEEK
jgi:hypothetical protein